MLFTGAKVSHLAVLPQGRVEAGRRVCVMTEEMLRAGFGNCGNHYECEAICPKGIKVKFIAKLNREFVKAQAPGSGCKDGAADRVPTPPDEED
jgi:succinate dehydrogenase / fumarate reductase iron-sulfur subunit